MNLTGQTMTTPVVDQAAGSTDAAPVEPVPTPPAATAPADAKPKHWQNPWLIVTVVAVVLAGWQMFETRSRLAKTQNEMARRLSDSDVVAKESRAVAKQAQEQLSQLQAKLAELDGKLAESKSQQATLEALYRDLARSRDEWALAEVEQGVTLAAQQLQLAANVQGALLALQAADARLAASNRPQFIALRKVLVRDLERLRALPQVDLPGMSLRLESVIAATEVLPLAVDGRPREDGRTEGDPRQALSAASLQTSAFWQQLALDFWAELRSLVRIQRFDREEPALLAPGQDFFLRENLRLRLLNARLALLSRDQWTYRKELKQAQDWIERYFDQREKSVQAAQTAIRQLSQAEINIALPNLNESLSAIKNFKLGKDVN